MTPYEIILTVVLAIWLIHYIVWGRRAARVVTQHKRSFFMDHLETSHPVDPDWPPEELKFP